MRVAAGIFNVGVAAVLLAATYHLGPLAWLAVLPLAGAALIFWTVNHLQQATRN